MKKTSSCASHQSQNLDELIKNNDLESLRPYLIREHCFNLNADGAKAAITMEELKKLARAYKLNERRNFWKMFTQRDAMVDVLCSYILEKNKLRSRAIGGVSNIASFNQSSFVNDGVDANNSINSLNDASIVSAVSIYASTNNVSIAGNYPPHLPVNSNKLSSKGKSIRQMKNYCGVQLYFRQVSSNEITVKSRFLSSEDPGSHSLDLEFKPETVVNSLRETDIDMKETLSVIPESNRGKRHSALIIQSPSNSKKTVIISARDQLMKHRVLSSHLAYYSCNIDTNIPITITSIQTFVNLADTSDYVVALNVLSGISNLLRIPKCRHLLLELNNMYKFISLVHIVGQTCHEGTLSAALFYYYFSCENEIEDRVYNESQTVIHSHVDCVNEQILRITLHTLNNLLTCVDRVRVVELIIQILTVCYFPSPSQDSRLSVTNRENVLMFLQIVTNACIFLNLHIVMFKCDVLEILSMMTDYAISIDDKAIGTAIIKVLNYLLYHCEATVSYISIDYATVLCKLLHFTDQSVLVYTFKCLAILSGSDRFQDIVIDSDMVLPFVSIIMSMDVKKRLSVAAATDAAKYLFNATTYTGKNKDVYYTGLVDNGIHKAAMQLLQLTSYNKEVLLYSTKCLLNLLSVPIESYYQVATSCFSTIMDAIAKSYGIDSINCLYNISCVFQAMSVVGKHETAMAMEMYNRKIHLDVLDFFYSTTVALVDASAALLHVLVHMCYQPSVVADLLEAQLLSKIADKIDDIVATGSKEESIVICDSIAKLILSITSCYCPSSVAIAVSDKTSVTATYRQLSSAEVESVISLLTTICRHGRTDTQIMTKCSVILAYLTILDIDCMRINSILRHVIAASTSDNMVIAEGISAVLYNCSCTDAGVALMLKDDFLLNVIIKILRYGNSATQLNMLECIRTLALCNRCVEIMLNGTILSDLIVIALLRTSSIDIKLVCAETFYNMLCHSTTRLRLITGEFMWGMGRLCREDDRAIAITCSRILLDLSIKSITTTATTAATGTSDGVADDSQIIFDVLRTNRIISFMVDIGSSISADLLNNIIYAVANYASLFDDRTPAAVTYAAPYETISVVRIALDGINRMSRLAPLATAISLLTKVIQKAEVGVADQECFKYEIADVLMKKSVIWSLDVGCRLNVCRLLHYLSYSHTFTKTVHFSDLVSVLSLCYSSQDAVTYDMGVNICGLMLNYMRRDAVKPADLVRIALFRYVLCDALGVCRGSLTYKDCKTEEDMKTAGVTAGVTSIPTMAIALLCSTIDAIIADDFTYNIQFIYAVMKEKYLLTHECRSFAVRILYSMSGNATMASYMMSANLVTILASYIHSEKERARHSIATSSPLSANNLLTASSNSITISRSQKAIIFSSSMLRNISMHKSNEVLRKLVGDSNSSAATAGMTIDVEYGISSLVSEMLNDVNTGDAVCHNISVTFYNIAMFYKLDKHMLLNPQFVLQMVEKINAGMTDTASDICINKYTVGIILEKYSTGVAVNPAFIQSTFTEMKSPQVAIVPSLLEEYEPVNPFGSVLLVQHVSLSRDLLLYCKQTCAAMIEIPAHSSPTLWQPIKTRCKKVITIDVAMINDSSAAVCNSTQIPTELLAPSPYQKIVASYDCIVIDQEKMHEVPMAAYDGSDDDQLADDVEEVHHPQLNALEIAPLTFGSSFNLLSSADKGNAPKMRQHR